MRPISASRFPIKPGKYFYVWLDAPIGYMASFKNLCARSPGSTSTTTGADSTTELYHFIGKDIIISIRLFWPAMLHAAPVPHAHGVFVHGFLTVDGQKMSKSRGTFIKARTYLDHLNPEYLRYYFAAKLGAAIEDIDLNLEDFEQRVNADLVGKLVNIASRCAGFITKQFRRAPGRKSARRRHCGRTHAAGDGIAEHYEAREFSRAMREVMALADRANQYIDERARGCWPRTPANARAEGAGGICSMGINLFRMLLIYLKPVLPRHPSAAEAFLATPR
jgi:methionyl-tRNA synthetase